MNITIDSGELLPLLAAVATVFTAVNGTALLLFKRRQDRILNEKSVVETENLKVDVSEKVLKIVNDQWTRDKLQWAHTKGKLVERTNLLLHRVEKLERHQELNILASTTHKAWDDQALSLARTVDNAFPPPPPILHPDTLIKDIQDEQLMLEIEDTEADYEL